jgi:hypothetical protein
MAKVFVAYSSHDSTQVNRLVGYLQLYGHEPILDRYELNPGDDLTVAIKAKIHSSHFFCPVLSPESVMSDWVSKIELPYAVSQKLRVIPILLQACERPPELQNVRYVDFTRDWDSGLIGLLKALPKTQYDEIENLRKSLGALRLGPSKQTLLGWLKRISLKRRDWSAVCAREIMQDLKVLRTTRRRLNTSYWWLIVHGVFRFKGIQREDMCFAVEDWQTSVACALVTERGVALLNDLHLEAATHESVTTRAVGRSKREEKKRTAQSS